MAINKGQGREGARILRPAGLYERYHITRHSLGLDSVVTLAAQFKNSDNKRLTEDLVLPAAAKAVQEHAALSVVIVGEKSAQPRFAQLDSVNLNEVVVFSTDEGGEIAQIIERQFRTSLDTSSSQPLWRLTITRDNLVVLAWHHAIADGLSGLIILRSILESLNFVQEHAMAVDQARFEGTNALSGLRPPVEELTDLTVSWMTLLKALAAVFLPASWTQRRGVWTGNPVLNSAPLPIRTHVRAISVPPDVVALILKRAKAESASLTAVLYILTISVLSKLLQAHESGPQHFEAIAGGISVSLRPYTKTPETILEDAVTAYTAVTPLMSTGFSWPLAAEFRADLLRALPSLREKTGLLKYLYGRYEEYFRGQLDGNREHAFELSNLGAFRLDNASETCKWTIGSTYFAQDNGVVGAALKVNVVGDPERALDICITWGDGAVDDGFANAFVRDFDDAIRDIAR